MQASKTILVVEDEKDLREAMVDTLSIKHFTVIEAKNGEEGVNMALQKHPDLILLDILMPKMDGMEALKQIRSDKWGANVPVIILTNFNATDEHIVEGMVAYKPAHYLIKADWDIYNVINQINEILEQKN